jgi:hypothetical protein
MGMRLNPELELRCLELAGRLPVAPPPDDASEAAFQADVLKYARGLGWLAYHTHTSKRSAPGFPDVVLARAPRLIVAELKVGDNRPTEAQEEWLAAFRAAGVPAFVWRPEDWPAIEATLRER